MGTHPDGQPLGTVIDPEHRKYRKMLHAIIDPLWQNQDRPKKRARGSVYGWMQRISGLSAKECHIGMFDKESCIRMLELIKQNPYEDRRSITKPE